MPPSTQQLLACRSNISLLRRLLQLVFVWALFVQGECISSQDALLQQRRHIAIHHSQLQLVRLSAPNDTAVALQVNALIDHTEKPSENQLGHHQIPNCFLFDDYRVL